MSLSRLDDSIPALWPPRAPGGLDPRRPEELAARLERFRRAFAALPEPREPGGLLCLDLNPIRERLAHHWPEQRATVLAIVEAAVARELNLDELYLVSDETTVCVFALERERTALRLRGDRIAALAGERLVGALPTPAALGVRILPFDPGEPLRGLAGLDALGEPVERARQRLAACLEDDGRRSPDKLVARYRPLLGLKRVGVVGYRIFARVLGANGEWLRPEAASAGGGGAFEAELDGSLLDRLTGALEDAGRRAARLLLVLPVHHVTLATPNWRRAWRERLAQLPRESVRRLGIELVDLDPQQRRATLEGVLEPLASDAAVPIVRLPIRSPPTTAAFDALAQAGVKVVSFDASTLDAAEPNAARRLEALAESCAAAGLRSLLVRVDRVDLAEAARRAGFDYLAGDGILPALAAPGPAAGSTTV